MVERVSTGIARLDKALEGGVPRGSWVAITGEPGTGKTILSMHFAWAGLRVGDPVVYVTTEQEFRDVLTQAAQFGMHLDEFPIYSLGWRKEPEEPPLIVVVDMFGLLKIARHMSERSREGEKARRYGVLSMDTLIEAINEAYDVLNVSQGGKGPGRHVRLIVDSMSAFWSDKPVMARKFSYQFKIAAHRDNVTAYLTSQYAMTTKSTFGFGLEHVADGVVHLWMDDVESAREVRRWLIIKKMRMTNHERRAMRLEVGKGGVSLVDA